MTGQPEWAIRCPWCQAPAGQRCTRPSGGHLAIPSHDARTTAWNDHQATQRDQQTGEPE